MTKEHPCAGSGALPSQHGQACAVAFFPALIAAVVVVMCFLSGCSATVANTGNTAAPTGPAVTFAATQPASATPSASPTPTPAASTPAPTPTPTVDPLAQYFTDGDVVVDGTSYKSADLSVKITNVSEGGQNYYIADCRMRDENKLFTALAKDKYKIHTSEKSSVMASRHGAVVAINGDYYGAAASDRSDRGVVIRNGTLYRSTPWYDIAAIFKDGTMKTYDKSAITADELMAQGAVQGLSFGPMLLDGNGKALAEAQLKSRSPHVSRTNPRSGIGYIEPNHFVLVVVDGRSPSKGRKGMTYEEFAKVFEGLGCQSAYNLDGGGSATMVFMGKVINHPCDAAGERRVSDIIYFGESVTDQANIDRINQ